MTRFTLLFTLISLLIITGCQDEQLLDDQDYQFLIDECDSIDQSKIVTEEELQSICMSTSVYYYNGELYLLCRCCICSKISFPVSCEGEHIGDDYDAYWDDFITNAEYLFSMTEE